MSHVFMSSIQLDDNGFCRFWVLDTQQSQAGTASSTQRGGSLENKWLQMLPLWSLNMLKQLHSSGALKVQICRETSTDVLVPTVWI